MTSFKKYEPTAEPVVAYRFQPETWQEFMKVCEYFGTEPSYYVMEHHRKSSWGVEVPIRVSESNYHNVARHGDWISQDVFGTYRVWSDTAFRNMYKVDGE